MAKASPAEIKELMKATGVGMMECKKAIEEADGDKEKAITLLREKGLATQAKKSGRAAAEGIVTAIVDGNVGVLLEVNTETDFAANTDDIKNFVAAVLRLSSKPILLTLRTSRPRPSAAVLPPLAKFSLSLLV